MSYLTPEEQEEVKKMEDLFAHPGWKLYLDSIKEAKKEYDAALHSVDNIHRVGYIQGYAARCKADADYEEFYHAMIEAVEAAREEEAKREEENHEPETYV